MRFPATYYPQAVEASAAACEWECRALRKACQVWWCRDSWFTIFFYSAAVKQQSRTSVTLPCNFTNDVVVGDITVAMIKYSSITWAISHCSLHDFILHCFNFYTVLILWSCTWLALIFLSGDCAKFGSYTMISLDGNRVMYIQLIQVNSKWNILWAVCFHHSLLYTLFSYIVS